MIVAYLISLPNTTLLDFLLFQDCNLPYLLSPDCYTSSGGTRCTAQSGNKIAVCVVIPSLGHNHTVHIVLVVKYIIMSSTIS